MPYRVDVRDAAGITVDRLIDLGALDVDRAEAGRIAAVMPDSVAPADVAAALGVVEVSVSPARQRDDGSVWVLRPPQVHVRGAGALTLVDATPFGSGLHPTTALCLEALQEAVDISRPDTVLDIGTGSGVLALAALMMGVGSAVATDIDHESLRVAAENACSNGLGDRLRLVRGGPEAVEGMWPLVLANILPAPLIEMAPALVRRVARQGELVLSGIPTSLEQQVEEAYRRLGMQRVRAGSRAGWVVLVLRASW